MSRIKIKEVSARKLMYGRKVSSKQGPSAMVTIKLHRFFARLKEKTINYFIYYFLNCLCTYHMRAATNSRYLHFIEALLTIKPR